MFMDNTYSKIFMIIYVVTLDKLMSAYQVGEMVATQFT